MKQAKLPRMEIPTNSLTSQDIAILAREWTDLKSRLGLTHVEEESSFLPSGWLKSQHGPAIGRLSFSAKVKRRLRRILLRLAGYRSDYDLIIGAIVGIDARLRRIESKIPPS